MSSTPPHTKNVLVIDGGGFRGLGCLLVIDSIMKAASSRARKPLLPCDVFDLICGTSTGGIIAILLGRLGLDCSTAITVYRDLTNAICGSDEHVFWKTMLSSIEVGFDPKQYEAAIASVVEKYAGDVDATMALARTNSGLTGEQNIKTFATVTSDAPTFNNRVYCIRSYPTRFRTSPVGHQWSIREAMRGTIASPLFLSPLYISKYGFRDSGFSGFNNPMELALQEFHELWPNDRPGALISIGTDFSSLAPQSLRRDWAVTDQYARIYAKQVVEKLPLSDQSSEAMRKHALNLVKQLVMLAVDTEIIHAETPSKFPQKDVYTRLNPPLGIANTDLVDIFNADEVERRVKTWLREEGSNYVSDIASKLVDLNEEPLTVEQARFVAPPAPPPDTNPGYNPQLDDPRPDTVDGYLRTYHVFFVIDDSGSMQGPRWSEARDALLEIADHALLQNSDEIDIRFLNSPLLCRGVKGADTVISIFDKVQPKGRTPTGATLEKVLNDYMNQLDLAVHTAQYYSLKPLDIIVLTDGVPTDDPQKIITSAVARMRAAKHHPNSVGVQIVQIGDDDGAVEALKNLMYGDVGSMVDTVPYGGVLTAKKLERILLGGLHPTVRAMIPV